MVYPQTRLFSTPYNSKSNVLTTSTTMKQDGSVIEELPILIRRVTRDSYPFTSHSYCGNIRDESDFEKTFKQTLQECTTVSDVFKLLEVTVLITFWGLAMLFTSITIQGLSALHALSPLTDFSTPAGLGFRRELPTHAQPSHYLR